MMSATSLPTAENFLQDALHDRDLLPDPLDWFGEEDARRFAHWGDSRLKIIHKRMIELDLITGLPVRSPIESFSTESIGIPDDIIAHVRKLRERKGKTGE